MVNTGWWMVKDGEWWWWWTHRFMRHPTTHLPAIRWCYTRWGWLIRYEDLTSQWGSEMKISPVASSLLPPWKGWTHPTSESWLTIDMLDNNKIWLSQLAIPTSINISDLMQGSMLVSRIAAMSTSEQILRLPPRKFMVVRVTNSWLNHYQPLLIVTHRWDQIMINRS